jgi:hypothetical protein
MIAIALGDEEARTALISAQKRTLECEWLGLLSHL